MIFGDPCVAPDVLVGRQQQSTTLKMDHFQFIRIRANGSLQIVDVIWAWPACLYMCPYVRRAQQPQPRAYCAAKRASLADF
jgi:hypothetical protein